MFGDMIKKLGTYSISAWNMANSMQFIIVTTIFSYTWQSNSPPRVSVIIHFFFLLLNQGKAAKKMT